VFECSRSNAGIGIATSFGLLSGLSAGYRGGARCALSSRDFAAARGSWSSRRYTLTRKANAAEKDRNMRGSVFWQRHTVRANPAPQALVREARFWASFDPPIRPPRADLPVALGIRRSSNAVTGATSGTCPRQHPRLPPIRSTKSSAKVAQPRRGRRRRNWLRRPATRPELDRGPPSGGADERRLRDRRLQRRANQHAVTSGGNHTNCDQHHFDFGPG